MRAKSARKGKTQKDEKPLIRTRMWPRRAFRQAAVMVWTREGQRTSGVEPSTSCSPGCDSGAASASKHQQKCGNDIPIQPYSGQEQPQQVANQPDPSRIWELARTNASATANCSCAGQ